MAAAPVDGVLPPPPLACIGHDRTFGGNRAFHNFYNDYSHISDPNLRRRLALSEIDKVPFGMYRTSTPQSLPWQGPLLLSYLIPSGETEEGCGM